MLKFINEINNLIKFKFVYFFIFDCNVGCLLSGDIIVIRGSRLVCIPVGLYTAAEPFTNHLDSASQCKMCMYRFIRIIRYDIIIQNRCNSLSEKIQIKLFVQFVHRLILLQKSTVQSPVLICYFVFSLLYYYTAVVLSLSNYHIQCQTYTQDPAKICKVSANVEQKNCFHMLCECLLLHKNGLSTKFCYVEKIVSYFLKKIN